ncbi:MAG: ABC transporter substrate-binding protein [Promethearchaeota archaeon]
MDSNIVDQTNFKIFQSDIQIDSYLVPGITAPIPANLIIRIGLIHDLDDLYGAHSWNGLKLSAREVNEQGGVIINGTTYYIGLVVEDLAPNNTLLETMEAAENLINDHHPHFVTGGYNPNNYAYDYLEVFMDNKIPFISTVIFGPQLCDKVSENYDRYKYLFRTAPGNIEFLSFQFGNYVYYLCIYLNITYGGSVNKIAILRQNSQIWAAVASQFKTNLQAAGLNVVEEVSFDLNATEDDFETCWNQIDSAGAQVVMTFIDPELTQLGAMMSKKYQEVKPNCIPVNWGGFQELNTYWEAAQGGCQFNIVLQASYYTSKTPLTIPFYTNYFNEYGVEPTWSGAASHTAVKLVAHTVQETQDFHPEAIVSELEKINTSNPFTAVGGLLAFDLIHDVEMFYPFGYAIVCQWKYIDGSKEVVPFTLSPVWIYGYPDNISTGSLRLPYWGINGLLTDPPQPPGEFTMSSTALSPDYDGKFNLTWSNSEGADNYTIYMSDKSMNYISKSFDKFDYQRAVSPFQFSLKQGEYYFRVVAYNRTGETMSSNSVHVNIPGPGSFNLYCDAEDPDTDGNFDLIWTKSERAENYSVYRHTSKITSINESLTLVANQTAVSPYSISGLNSGQYYFVVVAHNELGSTISSNNEDVTVQLPFNWSVVIIISISSVASVASIFLVRKYWRHRVKLVSKTEEKEPLHKGKSGEKKIERNNK